LPLDALNRIVELKRGRAVPLTSLLPRSRRLEVSDSRLEGHITASQHRETYADGHWFVCRTYRIEDDDGAWQGSTYIDWYARLRRPGRVDGW